MTVAISFLGTTAYRVTTYVYGDRVYPGKYFAAALPHFFPELSRIHVLVTPTVQNHSNSAEVKDLLGDLYNPVPIPEGHSEADLWEIFLRLTDTVAYGERVIFDITNSFRSLPFLTFLAAAFLRAARGAEVAAVVYGAYEARDLDSNRSPVFELTPFVSLLDWIAATNEFVYTGNGGFLARLLDRESSKPGATSLRGASQALSEFSLAMMLCRPLQVMTKAAQLDQALENAAPDLAQWAKPFELLADRIQAEYSARALPDPTATANVEQSLRQQLALVDWYLRRNQIIQGMSLAREWLVTAAGWRLGQGFVLQADDRRKVERGISGLAMLGRKRPDAEGGGIYTEADLNPAGRAILAWSDRDDLKRLWNDVAGVRNDLDHVGMSPNPSTAAKLSSKAVKRIWPALEALAKSWGLTP